MSKIASPLLRAIKVPPPCLLPFLSLQLENASFSILWPIHSNIILYSPKYYLSNYQNSYTFMPSHWICCNAIKNKIILSKSSPVFSLCSSAALQAVLQVFEFCCSHLRRNDASLMRITHTTNVPPALAPFHPAHLPPSRTFVADPPPRWSATPPPFTTAIVTRHWQLRHIKSGVNPLPQNVNQSASQSIGGAAENSRPENGKRLQLNQQYIKGYAIR